MITKQAIVDATFGLMEKKSLDKITVTDIVKECHITRQTFYYHFQDIVDMMEWAMRQEMDQLLKKAKAGQSMEEALLAYLNSDEVTQPVRDAVFVADYHVGAIAMILYKWMQEKDVNLEQGVQQIIRIMRGELHL